MPPVASKLTEEDRLRIATWVEDRLRQTACNAGDYAGAVAPRRLNRREYHNTIRDLLGVDFAVADIFPADESGGAGFDTNGETLFVPPMMMERYMEAAQQDSRSRHHHAAAAQESSRRRDGAGRCPARSRAASRARPGTFGDAPIFVDGDYNLRVSIERPHDVAVQMS